LLAGEDRPAREKGGDCLRLSDRDPVADRRPDLLVPKPPRQLRAELFHFAVEYVGASMLDGDARRSEPILAVLVELCLALGRPPEAHERFAQLDAPLVRQAVAGRRTARPVALH